MVFNEDGSKCLFAYFLSYACFRLVYKWFLFLHKMSYVLGIAGYILIMFTLLGLNHVFGMKPSVSMDAGLLLLFYGLYYGVLGRDFAHICTDRIACKIGVCISSLVAPKILFSDLFVIQKSFLSLLSLFKTLIITSFSEKFSQ